MKGLACAPARLRAVVFDFDGTLAEPVLDFGHMRRELAGVVHPFVPGARPSPHVPVLEWLQGLAVEAQAREAGAGPALLAAAHARIQALEVEAAGRTRLFPFARALLAGLAARGVGTAVVTRNCSRALNMVFPDARTVVGAVLTRDDVARVKPDPGHLGAALAALGAAPGAALMVGDHPMEWRRAVAWARSPPGCSPEPEAGRALGRGGGFRARRLRRAARGAGPGGAPARRGGRRGPRRRGAPRARAGWTARGTRHRLAGRAPARCGRPGNPQPHGRP